MADGPMMDEDSRELLALVGRLRGEVERLRADHATLEHLRSQEYDYAGADMEAAYERIRALTAENAAMRPIVEAVARRPTEGFVEFEIVLAYNDNTGRMECLYCANEARPSETFQHEDTCPVALARAFVAAHPAALEG